MTVAAIFSGGPRDKRRNNLQGHDTPPKRIPVSAAECKAKNTPHGFYSLVDSDLTASGGPATYEWKTL